MESTIKIVEAERPGEEQRATFLEIEMTNKAGVYGGGVGNVMTSRNNVVNSVDSIACERGFWSVCIVPPSSER